MIYKERTDMCEFTAGLGIDFEICVYEELCNFCEPLHDIKSREERSWEYRNRCVMPDLTFRYGGTVFHVDCHYRWNLPKSRIELDYPGVYRFKERCFEPIKEEILEAYGIGGTPYYPEHIILTSKSNIHGNGIPVTRFMRLEREFDRLGFAGTVDMYLGKMRTWPWGSGTAA